ncbi:MAG: c-type cytochrome [Myxococcales bacterium]|nr:c-type cytochrome [Myxococcales bacterium]
MPLKILGFSSTAIGIFVALGAYLFQLSGGAGFATASGEVSAEAGEQVFWSKGKCSTCHSIGDEGSAVRCPNFGVKPPQFNEPVGLRAAKRKPGLSAVEYLVESVYDPGAFVVPGFPTGVMTPIHQPPIGLTDEEIRSVLLFLIAKSGLDADEVVTQQIASAQRRFAGRAPAVAANQGGASLRLPEGDAEEGLRVFQTMRCFQCHKVQGVALDVPELSPEQLEASVGPELTGIGAVQTQHYLLESILNPNAVILPDPSPDQKYSEEGASKMPSFGASMTFQEAIDLVAFLGSLKEAPAAGGGLLQPTAESRPAQGAAP